MDQDSGQQGCDTGGLKSWADRKWDERGREGEVGDGRGPAREAGQVGMVTVRQCLTQGITDTAQQRTRLSSARDVSLASSPPALSKCKEPTSVGGVHEPKR